MERGDAHIDNVRIEKAFTRDGCHRSPILATDFNSIYFEGRLSRLEVDGVEPTRRPIYPEKMIAGILHERHVSAGSSIVIIQHEAVGRDNCMWGHATQSPTVRNVNYGQNLGYNVCV